MQYKLKRKFGVVVRGAFIASVSFSLITSVLTTTSANAAAGVGIGPITGTIDVSYWGGTTRDAKTKAVGDLFMKKYPDVKVNYQNTADFTAYWTKLNVQAASNALPCVVQQQVRQINDYTGSKVLLDLAPLMKSGALTVSDIPAGVLDTGKAFNNKLYMIPYGSAFTTILFNQTALEKAGVALPKTGYNWIEYIAFLTEASQKLPSSMKASNLLGGAVGGYDLFVSYVASHNKGRQMFRADGSLAFPKKLLTDYWTIWENFRKTGVSVSVQGQTDEPLAIPSTNLITSKVASNVIPGNQFVTHQAAMTSLNPGTKLASMATPSGPFGSGGLIINSGWSISSNCNNLPASAAWINFWLNDIDAGKAFDNDNGVTTNPKVAAAIASNPALTEQQLRFLAVYKEIASNPKVVVVKFPAGGYTKLQADFKLSYENIAYGKSDIQKEAAAIFKKYNGW
jgi:multiple sugar transport system substrate-binding protein